MDYKPAELPGIRHLILPRPASPCIDFCGKVVEPADGSSVKPGQWVFGAASVHLLGGALAQFIIAKQEEVAILPDGLDPKWAAGICIAGLTAYQTIVPYCKEGSNLFINGGSGGTGVFGIQIAKAIGCHVTTTCSTANVELCKSLGADEVIDYKTQDILEVLKSSGRKYDRVVDNVGHDAKLYWKAHEYTSAKTPYTTVGGIMTFSFFMEAVAMRLLPSFLGGGQRKIVEYMTQRNTEDLSQVGMWMKDGKVKPITDSVFQFEDAIPAFEKLKTGRAKGKIIVVVSPDLV